MPKKRINRSCATDPPVSTVTMDPRTGIQTGRHKNTQTHIPWSTGGRQLKVYRRGQQERIIQQSLSPVRPLLHPNITPSYPHVFQQAGRGMLSCTVSMCCITARLIIPVKLQCFGVNCYLFSIMSLILATKEYQSFFMTLFYVSNVWTFSRMELSTMVKSGKEWQILTTMFRIYSFRITHKHMPMVATVLLSQPYHVFFSSIYCVIYFTVFLVTVN